MTLEEMRDELRGMIAVTDLHIRECPVSGEDPVKFLKTQRELVKMLSVVDEVIAGREAEKLTRKPKNPREFWEWFTGRNLDGKQVELLTYSWETITRIGMGHTYRENAEIFKDFKEIFWKLEMM